MAAPKHVTDFKNKYQSAAIAAAAGTKIFPETILAAAGLESSYGRSKLTQQANNFFGIKAAKGWTGDTVTFRTREEDAQGRSYFVNAAFCKYNSPEDSFRNYVKFISGPRYVKAGVHAAATPEQQFTALRKAGYATDTNYPAKLAAVLKMFGGYFSNFVRQNPATTGLGAIIGIAAIFFF